MKKDDKRTEIDKIIDPDEKGIMGQKVNKQVDVTKNMNGETTVKVYPFIPGQKEAVIITKEEDGTIKVDGEIQPIKDDY